MGSGPSRLYELFASYATPLYFVTFNVYQRHRILANDVTHSAFVSFAQAAADRNIAVGRYVIMPDHIHLFVQGGEEFLLSNWVGLLKQALSKTLLAAKPHWQTGFFDHVIRHEESYAEKWEYVWQNPVRANLVNEAAEWPYQGEIAKIDRV